MKKILVVVDYQNDFVDGSLGFPRAKQLEEGLFLRVMEAKKEGAPIFFTLDTHGSDYPHTREGRHLSIAHCVEGSPGMQLYGKLAAFETDSSIVKVTKSNFGSDRLAQMILETCGVPDVVELCGVVTNMCVLSNAVLLSTALPNTEICINAPLCAGPDERLHQAALDIMQGLHMQILM